MAPKKSSKASLKKAGTMAATAAAGREFLKHAWGEDKLKQVNALLDARDTSDTSADDEAPSTSNTTVGATTTTTTTASSSKALTKTKAKPKLSKARTMKNTAQEAKPILGKHVFGTTRADTKRRQAAMKATKTIQEVTKPAGRPKPALKRLGIMANTAKEGAAYIKRTAGNKKKGGNTTGGTRTGGRSKKTTKK